MKSSSYGMATKTSKIAMPYDEDFINQLQPQYGQEEEEEGFPFNVLRAVHPEHGEVGHIQYTDVGAQDPPAILMLRTHEPYKRKGVASWMADRLQERYPNQPVMMGSY